MDREFSLIQTRKTVIIDLLILAFVYFIPSLTHLLNYPVYYIEPMRISLFFSIVCLKERNNAYFLALSLPLFSYMVAGHPVAVKNIIMSVELVINVFLLFQLKDKKINLFTVSVLSIILSKVFYYLLKHVAIICGMMRAPLFDTPLLIQGIISVVLSLTFMFAYQEKSQ